MKLTSLLVSAVSAATALAAALDVYNPHVTFPVDGATLTYNQDYNVTWCDFSPAASVALWSDRTRDVSDAPPQITNKVAALFLRQGDNTTPGTATGPLLL